MDVRCAFEGGWPGGAFAVAWGPVAGLSHGSLAVVFVVPPEPVERVVVVAGFVAPPRRAVEPLVHAPEAVEPARVGGVGVVDDDVLEREPAPARRLTRFGRTDRAGRR